MARVAEYWHDGSAPAANSLWPSGFAAVRDERGRLLLARRADTRQWELPGGRVNIGESISDAVRREVAEETGLRVTVLGLLGVYTDPGHVMVHDTGEVRQQFALLFDAVVTAGEPRPDYQEIENVAWFAAEEIDDLPIHPGIRLRIRHAFTRQARVQID